MSTVYERFAPFIKDFIYRNRWERLRGIQVAAGKVLMDTDSHLLLCASTASGKTEAAFFPILTDFFWDRPSSVGALYIAPLKALINDQFDRLTALCEEGGIPVWAWHGDVAQSRKEKLLKNPSGILQITPESLEALLLRKHAALPALFGDLRYIVIDEIHSLMRGDRGLQTLCLIERLSRMAGVEPRRIGLSATIGDPAKAAAFLRGNSRRHVIVPKVESAPVRWRLSMAHFMIDGGPHGKYGHIPGSPLPEQDLTRFALEQSGVTDAPAAATDTAPQGADPGLAYIFEHTRGRKCLVFSNSREECEAVTSTLREYCAKRGERERFLIHHGNLSTSIRADAEGAMKDEENLLTICTTATLELGIDIGRLERAFQLDAPFTVSGFLQRMGRTGRRGKPSEMWFVMREEEPEPRAPFSAAIPWKLLQGIALVQCWWQERWVEPPRTGRLPFSLLYHQTLMTLASEGELTPPELARRVLGLSPFREITFADYRALLLHLLKTEQIERTEQGGLIVGLSGERNLKSFRFYAVFQENEEFSVRSESRELGTIVQPPPAGEKVAIAGRVWLVEDVDIKRHVVWVKPVEGRVPAFFGLCPGDIHTHVLEKMCDVLRTSDEPEYLLKSAKMRLREARRLARKTGADRAPLLRLGTDTWCLLPWLGTYAFLALERLIRLCCAKEIGLMALEVSRPYFMQIRMKADAPSFFRAVRCAAENLSDPMELLYPKEVPVFEKYDDRVPAELVRKGFAYGVLGVEEMRARVLGWTANTADAVVRPAIGQMERLSQA